MGCSVLQPALAVSHFAKARHTSLSPHRSSLWVFSGSERTSHRWCSIHGRGQYDPVLFRVIWCCESTMANGLFRSRVVCGDFVARASCGDLISCPLSYLRPAQRKALAPTRRMRRSPQGVPVPALTVSATERLRAGSAQAPEPPKPK